MVQYFQLSGFSAERAKLEEKEKKGRVTKPTLVSQTFRLQILDSTGDEDKTPNPSPIKGLTKPLGLGRPRSHG